jgi:hypothetical protein
MAALAPSVPPGKDGKIAPGGAVDKEAEKKAARAKRKAEKAEHKSGAKAAAP